MIHGLRHGDPHGRTADHDSPLLSIVALDPVPAYGAGAYRARWTWSWGVSHGYRHGQRHGRAPMWFKVYVNGELRATTRDTSAVVYATEAEGPKVSVVVVGPANGDAAYDPSLALESIAGNRARISWAPPDPLASDLLRYAVYWDAGTGTMDWDTPVAHVSENGSASYSWTSGPLADGTYKFGVRSLDSAGNADSNTTTASVTIASWPAAPTGLAYTYDADEKKVTLEWEGGATVNVYSNAGSGDIDYSSAEASAVTSPWTSAALAGPATFCYGVRAENGVAEEKNLVYVEFELDGDDVELARPNMPFGVDAVPAAGGTFQISAWLDPRRPIVNGRQAAAAAAVRVYHDNGTGTMDWVTPLGTATLALGPGGMYRISYTTGAYAHGTEVSFGVRASSASGYEDQNTETDSATADSQAPGAPKYLAGVAVNAVEGDR